MAHVTADRVRDTSTSTSTGNFVVSGTAPSGFRTLSAVLSVNDTFYYAIQLQNGSEWEVGIGTYSSANTFARTTVLSSSNAGSAVNFSAGTKDVFLTLAATKTVQITPSGIVELPASSTIGGEPIPISSTFTSETFTASAGQTTFTISGGYTVGQISVFRNGAKLVVPADVTASNGTTIVLVNSASLNDTIEIEKFTSIGLANAVLKTGDTMSGALTVPSLNVSGTSSSLTLTGVGQRIRGDFSNPTFSNRVMFQTTTTNSASVVGILPNGTAVRSKIEVYNNSDPTNAGRFALDQTGVDSRIDAAVYGSGTYLPMTFYTGGSQRILVDTSGNVGIGTSSPVNKLDIVGSMGRGAPVTKTGNFTLAATENWVICNGTGSITITLPAASSWTGREVSIKTIAAQTVVSASSNVVPIGSATAGTAILAAAAGRWATLVSDGTNWIIVQAA